MARFHPSLDDLEQLVAPMNGPEEAVARALARLDDGWTVYIQPRIGMDNPDFVALHDEHGVCIVEVEGWRPRAYRPGDHGRVERRDDDGVWRIADEQPRYQAHLHRAATWDGHYALPSDAEAPSSAVRAVVICPRLSTAEARELLACHAVTTEEYSIDVWGGDGLNRTIQRIVEGNSMLRPHPASMARLRRHLIPSEITYELDTPAKLSADARNIESNPTGARRRRVRGAAGSGKSFGLAARAARLASMRQQVLVLSWNVTLAQHHRALVDARCRDLGANPSFVSCVDFPTFCRQALEEARLRNVAIDDAPPNESFDQLVGRVAQAFRRGVDLCFDAVLVDEGQDFTLEWWNLLRRYVVVEEGEMLLVADPTQDLYRRASWTEDGNAIGGRFSGPWIELDGSYRMPDDLVATADDFAARHLDGDVRTATVGHDHDHVVGPSRATERQWVDIEPGADLGTAIGREVVRMLAEHPHLHPKDVVFLCADDRDGLAAVAEIERAGHLVHHLFALDDSERARRARRYWPDADHVKGCTIQSFAGWETPALVLGIGADDDEHLTYVGLTRVKSAATGPDPQITVVNGDDRLARFRTAFETQAAPLVHLQVS